ncbi:MAG: MoxR family ATPase [Candidatus Marinimicrobia bacterium]|nr:MoxR family ATPase [Candidatus Neomarinimicrobiota bacterium]MDP7715305.1 MoxR family ATPase [Candidatus Neomarinimicrobiota bacterium]
MNQILTNNTKQARADLLENLMVEVEKVFVGKRFVLELAVTSFLAKGHLLIEDIPGVGKTTLAKALSKALALDFSRIQFTSDMLPSDILGTSVFNPTTAEFSFRPGPIFSNIILADEINRTSPRTQSALLEGMNENQVTVDRETYPLPNPFFVLATQNPKEIQGTYFLPESQIDRFLLSITIGYPESSIEKSIIGGQNHNESFDQINKVLDPQQIEDLLKSVGTVATKEELTGYVHSIITATREDDDFDLGASTRAGIQMMAASRGYAVVKGRDYVTPDDIQTVAPYVLAHRLTLKESSSIIGDRNQILSKIEGILSSTPIP